jgi:hypothetical protein
MTHFLLFLLGIKYERSLKMMVVKPAASIYIQLKTNRFLQSEIDRLERTPASSFSEQLDGKRAALYHYRARLKTLEDDPEVYFNKP